MKVYIQIGLLLVACLYFSSAVFPEDSNADKIKIKKVVHTMGQIMISVECIAFVRADYNDAGERIETEPYREIKVLEVKL